MKMFKHFVFVLLGGVMMCCGLAFSQPYPVGHRNITFVDSSRSNRSISADIYYPAQSAGDNTPVATPPANGFPVIAFGHGFLLPVSVYQYLWEGVVPEGYIVALPRTEGGIAPQHQQLGLDLTYLIRRLQRENLNGSSPFFDAVGTTSCVMGHSMGGGASFLAAASDSTITAIANLAAAETNPSAIAAAELISKPALLFAGSDDCVTPPADHQIPMYNALASPCKTIVTLTGGSHCKFGENNFTCNLGELGCTGSISRTAQHELVLSFLLPWIDHHLRGNGASRCIFQERLVSETGITHEQECILLTPILTAYPEGEQIRLRWTSVPGACSYELLRGTESDFSYDPALRIYEGAELSFLDIGQGEIAIYRVWAK